MADLSQMSTEDLLRAYQGTRAPAPANDLSSMSTEDLLRAYQGAAKQAPDAPVTAGGLYRALDAGAARAGAAVGGAVGDISNLAVKGLDAATQYFDPKYVPPDRSKSILNKIPTNESVTAAMQRDLYGGNTSPTEAGPQYKGQNTAEEYAGTIGEFLPAAVGGPASLAGRAANVAIPAIASETAGQVTKGTAAEPYARVAGGLAAPAAMAGARRLVTPRQLQPGRQAMVDTLVQEGIVPTAGQRSGSKALQYAESTLGDFPGAGGQATAAADRSGQQFTRAALRRIGLEGDEITPAAVNRTVGNIQNEFERLSTANTLNVDQRMGQDIGLTLNRYGRKLHSQQRETINNIVEDLVPYLQSRAMPGDVYQVTRSDLSRMAHAARNSDPTYSDALRGIRDALDNAMRRSISPEDRAAWDQARRRWGNWRTLENAAKNTDVAGNVSITPQQLVQSAAARDRGGFARGLGDFNDLARAGQTIMRPMPNSGTAQRLFSAGLGGALMSPAGIPAAVAGLALPAAAGRALMSGPGQRYLGGQMLPPPPRGLSRRMLTGGALGSLAPAR